MSVTLRIRSSELSKICCAVNYSIYYFVDDGTDDELCNVIMAKYDKFGRDCNDMAYNKEAIGYTSCTQHNIFHNEKIYIYEFEDTENLRSWLDYAESLMHVEGRNDASMMGLDPTSVILALRDFCDGKPYIDHKIEKYYNAINNL